jgi:pyridoxamine 5'-phosphate oxidase
MDSPEFVFSSLHAVPEGQKSPTPYLPRARYCIMRGFWSELPENKHNNAPMNPRVYESEMPAFTTDVRMNKPIELFASSSGHAKDASQAQGSGGGGPCEAVWWIKECQVQWRMKGEAFVVGNDVEGEEKESSGVRTLKSEVGSRMRVVDAEKEGEWSWKRELTGHFGNNSPGLRGMSILSSWKRECCANSDLQARSRTRRQDSRATSLTMTRTSLWERRSKTWKTP